MAAGAFWRAESPPREARRSLKTQQHVRSELFGASVASRFEAVLRDGPELIPVESEASRGVYGPPEQYGPDSFPD